MTDQIGRIPAGGFRELGPINWVLAKSAARTVRAPKMHLFATLGQHKRLFLSMMPYSAVLLRGRLPLVDTELVILRVAHLRDSEYELQHHRWMGRRRGLDDPTQELIFAWPNATGAGGGNGADTSAAGAPVGRSSNGAAAAALSPSDQIARGTAATHVRPLLDGLFPRGLPVASTCLAIRFCRACMSAGSTTGSKSTLA